MKEKIIRFGRALKEPARSLFLLTFLTTIVLWLMIVIEAVLPRFHTPEGAVFFYIYVLLTYVFNKEFLDRWIRHLEWKNRPGEMLVLLWGLTLLILLIFEFVTHEEIFPPKTLFRIFEGVLVIFLGSLASKRSYYRKKRKKISRLKEKTKPALAQA